MAAHIHFRPGRVKADLDPLVGLLADKTRCRGTDIRSDPLTRVRPQRRILKNNAADVAASLIGSKSGIEADGQLIHFGILTLSAL